MATQQRRSQPVKQTNQPSRLLGNDENNRLFQLVGARCVVRLNIRTSYFRPLLYIRPSSFQTDSILNILMRALYIP